MRRIHVQQVEMGEWALDAAEAHHVRDVLRLGAGAEVEVFDAAGLSGQAIITRCDSSGVVVGVRQVRAGVGPGLAWGVAAAVPKGPRGDWMIEKLSELGTAEFVPLVTARSVVVPEGQGKRQRWMRLATEAAKQSRRTGVMQVGELIDVRRYLGQLRGPGWYLSCRASARSAAEVVDAMRSGAEAISSLSLLIGPEGGWTEEELEAFEQAGLTEVSLGATILRIETAAVAAAAIVAGVLAPSIQARQRNP